MTEKKTDRQIMQEAWIEARRIMREYVEAGPERDAEATFKLLTIAIVNERTNAVVDRVERRGKFAVVRGEVAIDPETGDTVSLGPRILAGYADLFGVPKATK